MPIIGRREVIDSYITFYSIAGDHPEMTLYNGLRKYFASCEEIVAIFHGHQLYDLDVTQHDLKGNRLKEKDFLIVNCSRKYIMVIEVKNTLAGNSVSKSHKQLEGAKDSLESWLGADLNDTWSFVPMTYCHYVAENITSNPYIIKGK